jgi:DNA invertase Pin-like site-specific DNA recombinase
VKRVALYARTSLGADRGQNPETQLVALRAWAERLGVEVVAEYVDQMSGTRADRGGLRALLDAAHRRQFDGVLIWALDRLSREGIGPMASYLERFKAAGVAVKSHQESWLDTESPVTDLLLAVFAWVARQERERIRERVKAGIARARASGRRFGRPRAIVDAGRVQQLLNQGLSVREIARQTGHSRATLTRRFRPAQKPPREDVDEGSESLDAVG